MQLISGISRQITTSLSCHAEQTHHRQTHRQAYLQQLLNGGQVRLAMKAVLFSVVVLVQRSRLYDLQQCTGHVGVLVQHLFTLCQLRQAGYGAHQVAGG